MVFTCSSSTLLIWGASLSEVILVHIGIQFLRATSFLSNIKLPVTPCLFSRVAPMPGFGFHGSSSTGFSACTEIYLSHLSWNWTSPFSWTNPSSSPALLVVYFYLFIFTLSFSQWKTTLAPASKDKFKTFPELIASMKLFQMNFN